MCPALHRLVWQQMKANGFSYSGLLIVTSIGWLSDVSFSVCVCYPCSGYEEGRINNKLKLQ